MCFLGVKTSWISKKCMASISGPVHWTNIQRMLQASFVWVTVHQGKLVSFARDLVLLLLKYTFYRIKIPVSSWITPFSSINILAALISSSMNVLFFFPSSFGSNKNHPESNSSSLFEGLWGTCLDLIRSLVMLYALNVRQFLKIMLLRNCFFNITAWGLAAPVISFGILAWCILRLRPSFALSLFPLLLLLLFSFSCLGLSFSFWLRKPPHLPACPNHQTESMWRRPQLLQNQSCPLTSSSVVDAVGEYVVASTGISTGAILHDFSVILPTPQCGKSFPNKFHTYEKLACFLIATAYSASNMTAHSDAFLNQIIEVTPALILRV